MKNILCLLVCFITLFLSSCSLNENIVTEVLDKNTIVDSGEYYSIYRINQTEFMLDIYGLEGEIAMSKKLNTL